MEERIENKIAEQLGIKVEDITRESNFMEDLGADSLDCIQLVMVLEDEFDIEIPDADAQKLQTVGQVIEYIESKTIKS